MSIAQAPGLRGARPQRTSGRGLARSSAGGLGVAGRGFWSADPPALSAKAEHGCVLATTTAHAFTDEDGMFLARDLFELGAVPFGDRVLELGVLGAVHRRLLGMFR